MKTNQDHKAIRRRLEDERAALAEQIDALTIANEDQQTDYGISHHYGDDATEVQLREQNLALRNNAADLIDQIDVALGRLDTGEYGICANCGREINPDRLEVKPYASLCIECQAAMEQERAIGG
jgi:RNA polymerase-binding protein DksA